MCGAFSLRSLAGICAMNALAGTAETRLSFCTGFQMSGNDLDDVGMSF